MSQYPRIVLTDTIVTWGQGGCSFFVRHGTVADIRPGSALEAAYGGSGNLSAVIPPSDPRRAPEMCDDFDKAALGNLGGTVTTPAVPVSEWIDSTTGCPRCGHFPSSFVNITGTTVTCSRCEWTFSLSTQSPTGTLSSAVTAGATALPVASGGLSFTAEMLVLVDTGAAAEVIAVGSGGTATSVPVPGRWSNVLAAYQGVARAHSSGAAFGQLSITGIFGTAPGEAQVPAAPGWGF